MGILPNRAKIKVKNPVKTTGFSLIEILLVLFVIGLIISIVSINISDRSALDQRIALKEFGNRINMVLSEAALTGKTWGLRIEKTNESNEESYFYRWLTLDTNQNPIPIWKYAQPQELQNEYRFPTQTSLALTINKEEITIDEKLITDESINKIRPHIVLNASGEITPFTLILKGEDSSDDTNNNLELKMDSLGRLILPKANQ